MSPAVQFLATLSIFFLPGLLLVAAAGGARRRRIELSAGEQLYLVFAGSLLVSGWTALVLAELGWFSSGRVAAVVAGSVLAAGLAVRKRLRLQLGVLRMDELAAGICLVGFALLVYFPPFEYVLGGKDPGVYINTGFHLAREGNLRYFDPLIRDIPPQARALFFRDTPGLPLWSQPRFLGFYMDRPDSGLVLPQGLHLYPVWVAVASGLFQMKSGLYATPTFALFALAGFFLAMKRLFGAEVGRWASVLLAVFQLEIWFARFPNGEMVMQFLYVTGLLGFYLMEKYRSSLAGGLAGLAFGSAFLLRVDSILFAIPLGLYLGWKRWDRQAGKPEAVFASTCLVLGAHAAVHAHLFSGPYISNVFGRWYWRWIGEHFPLLLAAAVAAFLLIDRFAAKRAASWLGALRHPKAGPWLAGGVYLLAVYAYFVRPVWHGARTAPHDAEAFFRMGWYLYPLGLALGVAGTMILLHRRPKHTGVFLLASLSYSLFYFYKIRVWNDHFFCMRRFIPVILPGLFAAMAVFLVELRTAGGRWGSWSSRLIGAALVFVYLVDGRPLWKHMEFRGSLRFVEEVARHIGDNDVVIFPRKEGLHLLELPLAQLYGRKVLEFYSLKPDPKLLERLFEAWRGRYGDIYFVTNYKINLSGFFTRHVADFALGTVKYEYTYTRPPKRAEPFHLRFTLSKAVDLAELARRMPKMKRIDVGGESDEPLLAWFFDRDLENATSFRWSQAVSSVFLAGWDRDVREIWIRLAGPEEPQAPPSRVALSLNGVPLGVVEPKADFETVRIALPPGLAQRLAQDYPVLRLESRTWRPANFIPGATDVRELGARVDWIELR